jgi:general nucleoside transport system permease protein
MLSVDLLTAILVATLGAGTPLALAAIGELVSERAGVLNLGVEGMMLVGAAVGFVATAESESMVIGILAGMGAGIGLSLIFAFLTLTCLANQVATGLALTIFGTGTSALIGAGYTGTVLVVRDSFSIPVLSDIPVLGALLFSLEPMTYLSLVIIGGVWFFLFRSRSGLVLRGVGDAPAAAHATGMSVILIRYMAVMFGGAMAGLAGAFLSVIYTPVWVENMTAGRGWIAVALVVFASWQPLRVLAGAYLFGGVTILQFHIQGASLGIPSQFLSMLPYLATIVVLVIMSSDAMRVKLNTPASLAKPFRAEG